MDKTSQNKNILRSREYELSPTLKIKLNKLFKKDKKLYFQVLNKINEIINSEYPEHYKNLRNDLKDYKRVHVSHYVLIFRIRKDNSIKFDDLEHHDTVYLKIRR